MQIFVAGSRKFSKEIQEFVKDCHENGIEALLPDKPLGELSFEQEKQALLQAFQLIDQAKCIYVYAKDGYVGKTVIVEMAYAFAKGYKIFASEIISENSVQALVGEVIGPDEFLVEFNN